MNVFTDEIEEITESIKLRMIARGGTWTVYVRTDGSMVMDRMRSGNRARTLPDEWIAGRYTKGASTADIKDDLVCRMWELRKVAA